MNYKRILFAHARGARIQYYWTGVKEWRNLRSPLGPETLQRIHPDDEHLEYGPLSSAIREYAKAYNPSTPKMSTLCSYALQVFYNMYEYPTYSDQKSIDLRWGFMAELLADEGL